MPEKLSLDEFSQKQGNRKFATVVCDLEKKSLLEIIDSHSLLLKNGRDLTEEEKTELVELLQKSPSLRRAYELKEEFRDIYETSTTVKMGRRRFKKWLITARCIFGSITQTIVKHLEEICNYFISRTSSGMMEGLNNKIKLILRY